MLGHRKTHKLKLEAGKKDKKYKKGIKDIWDTIKKA